MANALFQPVTVLGGSSSVILYGAGSAGRDVHAIVTRHGRKVRCFLDRNAQPGAHWQDTPIYSSEENPLDPQEGGELLVSLDSWRLGYRFHLRLHAYDGLEAVVYAVPA